MYCYEMTAVGMEHEHQGKPCQDYVATFQWNGVTAQVCVDGEVGAEARSLSETLAQNLAMYFRAWHRMADDQLAAEVLHVVRNVQSGMEEHGGCTLVVAAMDTRTCDYLGVSLGDGILLARERFSGQVITLLPPQRRADGSACTTGDEDEEILRHVRVARGRAKDALIVSSDGLENVLWDESGSTLSPTLGKLMKWVVEDIEGVRTDFTELVYDLSLPDDAGLAVMVAEAAGRNRWEERAPERFCQRRRDSFRYRSYLNKRPAGTGYSRADAARHAGWRPTRRGEELHRRWLAKAA